MTRTFNSSKQAHNLLALAKDSLISFKYFSNKQEKFHIYGLL